MTSLLSPANVKLMCLRLKFLLPSEHSDPGWMPDCLGGVKGGREADVNPPSPSPLTDTTVHRLDGNTSSSLGQKSQTASKNYTTLRCL
ncbi:hypothetical protein BaRGS_00000506 [Batillaria attramentaria]|uniref:Uncharacterized protein n=1 Tax=Batillaria attramentaria TaxID=370345 RepID=A0ABD0M9M1_9CAEN